MNSQLSLFRPLTEPEKKRIELERMNSEKYARRIYLEKLRTRARRLVHVNYSTKIGLDLPYVVCTDFIRDSLGIKTRNRWDKSNNLNGVIFRCKGWKYVTGYQSKVHNSHNNEIGLWTLDQYWPIVEKALNERNAQNQ